MHRKPSRKIRVIFWNDILNFFNNNVYVIIFYKIKDNNILNFILQTIFNKYDIYKMIKNKILNIKIIFKNRLEIF